MGTNESKNASGNYDDMNDTGNAIILNKCHFDGSPDKGIWLYKSFSNNHWWFMSPYISDTFEEWYVNPYSRPVSDESNSTATCFVATYNNNQYKIDFDKLTQTHVASNRVRKIMRLSPHELPDQSSYEFAWTYTTGSGDKRFHESAQSHITNCYNMWTMNRTTDLYPLTVSDTTDQSEGQGQGCRVNLLMSEPLTPKHIMENTSDPEQDHSTTDELFDTTVTVSVLTEVAYLSPQGLVINNNTYRFDFNRMEQINIETGRHRSIKYQIQV